MKIQSTNSIGFYPKSAAQAHSSFVCSYNPSSFVNFALQRDIVSFSSSNNSLESRLRRDLSQLENYERKIQPWEDRILSNILNGAKDDVTGQIDKRALDFVDKFLFEKQGRLPNAGSIQDKVNFGYTLDFLLSSMKDKNGHFNQKNIDFISKLISSRRNFDSESMLSFLDDVRGEDGVVVESKAKFALETIEKATNTTNVSPFIGEFARYSPKDAKKLFDFCLKTHYDYSSALEYFYRFTSFVFDWDKNFSQENFEFLKILQEIRPDWSWNINELSLFSSSSHPVNENIKQKALEMAQYKRCSMEDFVELYWFSSDKEKGFQAEIFDKYKTLFEENPSPAGIYSTKNIFLLFRMYANLDELNFNSCYKLLEGLEALAKEAGGTIETSKVKIDLNKMMNDVSNKITGQSAVREVEAQAVEAFKKNVLYSRDFDNVFANSIYELENGSFQENPSLNRAIEEIKKGIPEFENIVARKQHGEHIYTLDIHTLLVLANIINNPKYKKLSKEDKAVLKLCAILHDFAKEEGQDNPKHPEHSAIMTGGIVDRFIKDKEEKKRILNLIRTHEWLKEYSISSNKSQTAQLIALKFRRGNDFALAKIFTRADILSINHTLPDIFLPSLDKTQLIQSYIDRFNASGCAVFSDYPKEGFRIINLRKIGDGEDLSPYGFKAGKKKDLKFLVHMVSNHGLEKTLNTIKLLTNSAHESTFSLSLVSPWHKATFENRKVGFIMDVNNYDIISIYPLNQDSGTQKDENKVRELVNRSTRSYFSNNLTKALKINPTGKQFADFYQKTLANINPLDEIDDSREYKIGDNVLKGSQIKEAIRAFQNSLLQNPASEHNEIVAYNPAIKAVVVFAKSEKQIPDEIMKFAKENDLPVVIM